MRHKKKGRKLNRNSAHRNLMLINMTKSLLKYGCIKTTLAKAKQLKIFAEPILSRSRFYSLSNYRFLKRKINDRFLLNKLFSYLSKTNILTGGWLRILKCGFRNGDMSCMAFVELIIR